VHSHHKIYSQLTTLDLEWVIILFRWPDGGAISSFHSPTNFFFLSPTSACLTRLGAEGYYSFDHTQ
jgi:hypothetical protein